MKAILKNVLAEIKPDKELEKRVDTRIKEFLLKIDSGLKDAKAILGGSGAKGTWLRGAHDADIFVCFDYKKYKDKSSELSDILEKHLKKKVSGLMRLHGSRDYFQVKEKDFTFEIVPILKISKAIDAVNITDVSPLHAKWVLKHKKFADDIRLTKQFCKANSVYGAESYINGFSGYICEILTIYYGGFMKFVRAASKWGNEKVIVDAEKYYKNRHEIVMSINKSKQVSPMIVIDPVQKDRNAAAALSAEKYLKFIDICKRFLVAPSKDFFTIKQIDENMLSKKAGKNRLILLEAHSTDGKEDIVGVKLLKAYEFLVARLKANEFRVIDSGWSWDKGEKALFWMIVDPKLLSEEVEREGPLLRDKKHVEAFKQKHANNFEKGKRIYALDKRKYRDALEMIKELVNDGYLKDKVKRILLRD